MTEAPKGLFLPAPSKKHQQKSSTTFDVFDTSFQSSKPSSLATVDKDKKTVKIQRSFDTSLFEDKQKDFEEEKVLKKPKIDFSTKLSGILPPPKSLESTFSKKPLQETEKTKQSEKELEEEEDDEKSNNFFSFLPKSLLKSSVNEDQSEDEQDEQDDQDKIIQKKKASLSATDAKNETTTGSAKIAKGISLGLAYDDSDDDDDENTEHQQLPEASKPSCSTPSPAPVVTKSLQKPSNQTSSSSSSPTAPAPSASYANQLPRKLGPNKPALPPLQSVATSYPSAYPSSNPSPLPSSSAATSAYHAPFNSTYPSSVPTSSFDNLPTATPGPSVSYPPDNSFEMYPEVEPEDPLLSSAAQQFGARYLSEIASGQAQILEIDQKELLPPPSTAAKIIKVHEPTIKLPIGMMPGKNSRRRHQITYLAFEAKQRELEFAEKKAQSLKTKSEVQAKYGW